MSSSRQLVLERLSRSLAIMLGLTMASAALAATDSDATAAVQAPIAQTQELDEIWVRGKSLSRMIEDAEDQFIRHYNKLNKDRDFDVACDYLRLDPNSLAMTRTCVPYFLGYLGVGAGVGASGAGIPQAGTSMCSPGYYINTDSGTYYSSGSCTSAFSSYTRYSSYNGYTTYTGNSSYGRNSAPISRPALHGPADPEVEKKRQGYVRALLRTIYSDQQLLEEATTLAELYGEMKTVQDHYQMVKAEEDARKEATRRERREQRSRNSTQPPRTNNPRL